MRKNSPSLVPRQPAYGTVYIVLDDFGPKLGHAYRETDESEADEKTVIENMISGQYSNPLRVVAFNTEGGWARDVSEDIARAVADRLQTEGRAISDDGVRRFVAQQFDIQG